MPKIKEESKDETEEEESEEELSELEELAEIESEEPTITEFQEFITQGEMPVPTLTEEPVLITPENPEGLQSLENQAAEAPTREEEQRTEQDYVTVYNAPDYQETEMPELKEMRERRIITTPHEMIEHAIDTTHLRPLKIEQWHELPEQRGQEYEVVTETKREEDRERDREKLPFQQTRKEYKPKT